MALAVLGCEVRTGPSCHLITLLLSVWFGDTSREETNRSVAVLSLSAAIHTVHLMLLRSYIHDLIS